MTTRATRLPRKQERIWDNGLAWLIWKELSINYYYVSIRRGRSWAPPYYRLSSAILEETFPKGEQFLGELDSDFRLVKEIIDQVSVTGFIEGWAVT